MLSFAIINCKFHVYSNHSATSYTCIISSNEGTIHYVYVPREWQAQEPTQLPENYQESMTQWQRQIVFPEKWNSDKARKHGVQRGPEWLETGVSPAIHKTESQALRPLSLKPGYLHAPAPHGLTWSIILWSITFTSDQQQGASCCPGMSCCILDCSLAVLCTVVPRGAYEFNSLWYRGKLDYIFHFRTVNFVPNIHILVFDYRL